MVMREEHPFHPPHADLREMIEHAAVAQIDQQRRIAIPQHVHVARIGPDEQIRPATTARNCDAAPNRSAAETQDTETPATVPRSRYSHHVILQKSLQAIRTPDVAASMSS